MNKETTAENMQQSQHDGKPMLYACAIGELETIAEELRLYMGLDAKVVNGKIEIDTVAGKMICGRSEKTIMGDVYRIISNYGIKLHSWGLKMKLGVGQHGV